MAITSLSTSSLVSGVKRRRVWDQTATTDGFFQIATTTLNTTASSITFSSIPQDYTHLQIRYLARGTVSATGVGLRTRLNNDSGSNYSTHQLYGDGSSVATNGNGNQTELAVGGMSAASAGSGIFGVGIIDILDYNNTNKYKTFRAIDGRDINGGGLVLIESGNWRSNNSISSILFYLSSDNFAQYTSFALYGIKG
jgi:hypothetical protein